MAGSKLIFNATTREYTPCDPITGQPEQPQPSVRKKAVIDIIYHREEAANALFCISRLSGVQQFVTEQIKQRNQVRYSHLEALRDDARLLADICTAILEDAEEEA